MYQLLCLYETSRKKNSFEKHKKSIHYPYDNGILDQNDCTHQLLYPHSIRFKGYQDKSLVFTSLYFSVCDSPFRKYAHIDKTNPFSFANSFIQKTKTPLKRFEHVHSLCMRELQLIWMDDGKE